MKYRNLNKAKMICFDIETYDPLLLEKGTGVYRKDGYILGCAISDGETSEYYNIGHTGISQKEKEKNIAYLKEVLGNDVPKLATNLLYDCDWLQNGYGIQINGELNDIQIAEPLICEFRSSYSLDNLGKIYINQTKKKDQIKQFCEDNNLKGDPRKHLYKMPYRLVAEYAKVDVELPLNIFAEQQKYLDDEDLMGVYTMERELIPLLLRMKKNGVKLDPSKVQENRKKLENSIQKNQKELDKEFKRPINVKSPKDKQAILDSLNIPYPKNEPTEKMKEKGIPEGNPKLNKNFLKTVDHPTVKKILAISELRTILSNFFINSFTEARVHDRIHCNFNPLKSDNYGTISGRFSSSNPNLQQIPGKEETMGNYCREVFIPEEGMLWGKLDWSQIEYRLIAHYASGEGADKIREQYNDDPKTDYHKYVMDLTGLERKDAKIMNFGLAYFMGVKALSNTFGWSLEEAQSLINIYHSKVPFLKSTRMSVVNVGKKRGYVKTILGRKARVSPKMILEHKEYSIFNRLIQGSAADLMKKAMVDADKAGVFNVLTPMLTVHDELDISIPRTKKGIAASKELKHIMENCVKLRVPIIADFEIGDNWANVSEERANNFLKGDINA